MFRCDCEGPPRRHDDADEEEYQEPDERSVDRDDELSFHDIPRPVNKPLAPPVLRWRKSWTGNGVEVDGVHKCELMVVATRKACSLLPAFGSLEEKTFVGSVLVPGVGLRGNAVNVWHPDNIACNIYKPKGRDCLLVCCSMHIPLEAVHAWMSELFRHISPSSVLVLDFGTDACWPPNPTESPFDLRSIVTSSLSSKHRSFVTSLEAIARPLDLACPVGGATAALLARCQMSHIPAAAVLGRLSPCSSSEVLRVVEPLVECLLGLNGESVQSAAPGVLDAFSKKVVMHTQARLQVDSSLYT